MASSFVVPKGQEGLLLRSPLTYGFSPHTTARLSKPIYTKDTAKTYVLGQKDQDILLKQPQKLAFYTRNNPHPARVCHMKGLLDVPICRVEDTAEPRYLLSPPTGQDFGQIYVPLKGNTRYSGNINKGIPAVGVVPVTTAWRDELESKTQNAILRAMGESVPSRGSMDSQTGIRKEKLFDQLQDERLLDLLCRILQTESIPACLAWLSSATESEKTIVLNMIKMAACGELHGSSLFPTRSHTADSQFRYVWAPENSHTKKHGKPNPAHNNNDDADAPYETRKQEEQFGGLYETMDDAPFKLPENDTIIRTAHQLSRLASRNSARASVQGMKGLNPFSKEKGGGDVHKMLAQKLKEHAVGGDKIRRQRSSSLTLPAPAKHIREQSATVKRKRSRSMQASGGPRKGEGGDSRLPPIPKKASVTKETLSGSGPRLRYTSHWET